MLLLNNTGIKKMLFLLIYFISLVYTMAEVVSGIVTRSFLSSWLLLTILMIFLGTNFVYDAMMNQVNNGDVRCINTVNSNEMKQCYSSYGSKRRKDLKLSLILKYTYIFLLLNGTVLRNCFVASEPTYSFAVKLSSNDVDTKAQIRCI